MAWGWVEALLPFNDANQKSVPTANLERAGNDWASRNYPGLKGEGESLPKPFTACMAYVSALSDAIAADQVKARRERERRRNQPGMLTRAASWVMKSVN
jgi:hypothetical protein